MLTPEPEAVANNTINPRTAPNAIALGMTNTKDTNPKDAIGGNKPSYSAVPVPVLYELGAALSEGARKYGGYNWRVAGVRASVYINATRRHLDAWWEGEDIDPDSGLSHVTKALASLTVLRDAMIQGMLSNDDRPPRAAEFMPVMQARMNELAQRYPDPKPPFTEREVAHIRNTPVEVNAGQILGYDIEVMLPADDAPEGFVWAQQGSRRTDIDLALTVAQALREDGYGERVVRVMEARQRVELMHDQTEWVQGELRAPLATVFPGDPSLTALTEEEAEEIAAEEVKETCTALAPLAPYEEPEAAAEEELDPRDDFSQPDPFGEGRY